MLLALTLVLGMLPAAVFAAEPATEGIPAETLSEETLPAETAPEETTPEETTPEETTPEETKPEETPKATVSFTAQAAGAFLCAPQKDVEIAGNLAESYGYSDSVKDGVSALDVLVKAHEVIYGSDFTKETCKDYLAVSDSGWATNVLGLGSNFSFAVNGAMPHDGVFNEQYGSYTAYTINQAAVGTGDDVEFFFYQDEEMYLDNYAWFTGEFTGGPEGSLSLTLSGYCYCYYGAFKEEKIQELTEPIADAQLAWVDSATGALTDITGAVTDEAGVATVKLPKEPGTYLLTAYMPAEEITEYYATPVILPLQTVTVLPAPTSVEIRFESNRLLDGDLIADKDETFQLKAYDENGAETPVTWRVTQTWCPVTIDENTGVFTITQETSSGGSSMLYFEAASKLDPTVKSKEYRLSLKGYRFSSYARETTVELSEDGQSAKTVSLGAGLSGHSIWSYTGTDGIANLISDPGNGTNIKFQILRPGVFQVSIGLDIDETLTDTATVTVTGIAVEDAQGTQGKTYMTISTAQPNPTAQLTAYCETGHTVTGWSSGNETVATVDENGLVTARGVGSTIITATDDQGRKGGIKVVVTSEDIPYFESLEFMTTAFTSGTWVAGETFQPTKLEYTLPIRTYSVSQLTLQATTLYDDTRYTATAAYTDVNGEQAEVNVNSGAITYLKNIPFGESTVTITLADKEDGAKATVYTFHVTRPRDTSNTIKNNGAVLVPDGRNLLTTKYQGYAEGTMLRADETGTPTSGTGVVAKTYDYRTYLLSGTQKFALTFTGKTVYTHLRYSADGETWTELPQGGGTTETITLPEGKVAKVQVQILGDASYVANGGFANAPAEDVTTYTVYVEGVSADAADAQILTAESGEGDWYPAFTSDHYAYNIVVPNGTKEGTLRFTVTEGTSVKVGSAEQTPDENGVYTLTLKTSNQTVTVTSADGTVTNSYTFKIQAKSKYPGADKVVDFLCINSQYTNGGYGLLPEATLSGSLKSLGNFGGYITWYSANGWTDNPANPYGVDFYVYGNAFDDGGSAAENGQVWVSEDGETWYALAGSEHYEKTTLWDYTVTYTRTANGKTAWQDNYGNRNDGSSQTGAWPKAENYPMNGLLTGDSITLSGILLPSMDGTITGDGTTGAFVSPVSFGYVDHFANGSLGASVNPYMENPTKNNGFDLAWAVDGEGNPVNVSGKTFHYVKVVTANNIWAGAFNEKSTEVSQLVTAQAAEEAVGKTNAPVGVVISDGAEQKKVYFQENQQVYTVDIGSMKYVSLTVDGTAQDDNIYINNQRVASGAAATGFRVTNAGETLVRVIVQNGEKEPQLYLLKLTGTAEETDDLISGIKVNLEGGIRQAETTDGKTYTLTVGYRMDSAVIVPLVDSETSCTINGEAVAASYALESGENTFEITAVRGEQTQTVTLIVTREKAPEESGKTVTVTFALYGDEKHGVDGQKHLYHDGTEDMQEWLPATSFTVAEESTVLDVFELALKDGHTWTNAGGNYIAEIDGLAEFDNGANSGWMYTVNGLYPNRGLAEQPVAEGDAIVFHYTDDYTAENKAWSQGQERIADVIAKIDAIGTVTLESQAAIQAARGAYDALRPEEQAQVTNYETLVKAEEALAALLKGHGDPDAVYAKTRAYLENLEKSYTPVVGSIGGEWMVLGLMRSGSAIPNGYYTNVLKAVEKDINDAEQLHWFKSTENSRVILALTALGADVTNVGGHNLLSGLTDMTYVKAQGINGPIWALIAYDSGAYEIPAAPEGKEQTTREALIATILDAQRPDGGWALEGDENPDMDITAMAIQALAPYYGKNEEVKAAVDAALALLSQKQNFDGSFNATWDGANAESCAQVLVALTALGIDPATDARFVKNGRTVVDALCDFALEDGGFRHTLDGERDGMATEQGYYALCAYARFRQQANRLYDMTDAGKIAFTDVPVTEYYADAVNFAAWNGYVNGVPGDRFVPLDGLSRGQIVTILYRVAGEPEGTWTENFSDVSEDAYYSRAIAWAVEQGIAKGYPDGTFRPDATATRQEMVTFFYRFAGNPKAPETGKNVASFRDGSTVADYALEAMTWAVRTDLILGNPDGTLKPNSTTRRCEAVTVLYRFCRMA